MGYFITQQTCNCFAIKLTVLIYFKNSNISVYPEKWIKIQISAGVLSQIAKVLQSEDKTKMKLLNACNAIINSALSAKARLIRLANVLLSILINSINLQRLRIFGTVLDAGLKSKRMMDAAI